MGLLTRTLQQAPGDGRKDQCSYLACLARSKLLNQFGFYTQLLGMTVTTDTVNAESATLDYDYSCRFMTMAELQACSDDPACKLPADFLEEALGRGDRCYGIFDGDHLASYGWYCFGPPNKFNDELDILFNPGWVYMYKGYTLPNYRGQKLHAVGMTRALATVTEEGHEGLISCVAAVNAPSLRSCERVGYNIFGSVKVTKWIDSERLGPISAWRIRTTDTCRPYGLDVVKVQPGPGC